MEFKGIWGDKYSKETMNIKIEKKDGKIFFISPEDIKNYLELLSLLESKEEIENRINSLSTGK